jgi:hypothetical protein
MFRVSPSVAGTYQYTTLSIAGQQASYATGINDNNRVAGTFLDAGGVSHGFVWDAGAFTQVDGAGALSTELNSINAKGIAAGDYLPASGTGRIAFTYNTASGQQQMLTINPKYGFYEAGINRSGVVVGFAEGGRNKVLGFDGKANGKKVKLLSVPGTVETLAFGINGSGTVVGSYLDSLGIYHGYVYQSGTYTKFDPPGSAVTAAASITDAGIVYGNYTDDMGERHGFTMSGGSFTIYDYPGAVGSVVVGIGPGGEVVGNWDDGSDAQHGFVVVGGTYYTIDRPGASGTTIAAVNDEGSLVGNFTEGQEQGFIAQCPAGQSPCTH